MKGMRKLVTHNKNWLNYESTIHIRQQRKNNRCFYPHTEMGRHERDEMQPSIEVVKKNAKLIDTTVVTFLVTLTRKIY